MRRTVRILYRPFALTFGVLGGVIAGSLFTRLWRILGHEPDAPKATDRDRRVGEVVAAAALHGAVFGATKALVDRVGAHGFERLTGVWPGRADASRRTG